MAFLDFLFGKGEKTEQFQNFTPEQQGSLNEILGGARSQLPSGFDFLSSILSGSPEAQARFEAPARRAFAEETLPSIAERFTGLGAQKSSAFGQQLGKAGAALEENLAAQRAGRSFDALSQLQQLLGTGLTQQFDNVFRPATTGFLGGLGEGAAQGLGQAGTIAALLKLLPALGL